MQGRLRTSNLLHVVIVEQVIDWHFILPGSPAPGTKHGISVIFITNRLVRCMQRTGWPSSLPSSHVQSVTSRLALHFKFQTALFRASRGCFTGIALALAGAPAIPLRAFLRRSPLCGGTCFLPPFFGPCRVGFHVLHVHGSNTVSPTNQVCLWLEPCHRTQVRHRPERHRPDGHCVARAPTTRQRTFRANLVLTNLDQQIQ